MTTHIEARRAAGTLVGLAAGQTLMWIGAAALADETSAPQKGFSVLLGLLSAALLASLGEWTVHRYSMHTRWRNRLLNIPYELHHVAHHWHHYTPDRFTHAGPVKYHPTSDPNAVCATNAARYWVATQQFIYYMFFAVVFLFTPAWLITGNIAFMIGLIPPIPFVCVLFVHVHDTTHHPGNRLIERFGWFRFLKHHHYIHHIDNGSNVNFLLPFCDLLFGTLRTSLQPGELARWGTFEDALARVVPVGEGQI